uniref:Vomeronasal type-1 receptor n=1 Tax=Panagrolaimus sp. PS1159 TaxID=55785 RepID=A0AC35F949_9BILA
MSAFLKSHKINEYIAMVFGISSNILLMYLILTTKKKEMKALSQMLIQNCVLDLIFLTVNTFPQPQVAVGQQSYYIVVGNYFSNDDFVYSSFAVTNFCGFVMLSLYALPVPFYLRYLVLCR